MRENRASDCPTMFNTNKSVQSQQKAISDLERMRYCTIHGAKNKDTDKLCSYCMQHADPSLYFRDYTGNI